MTEPLSANDRSSADGWYQQALAARRAGSADEAKAICFKAIEAFEESDPKQHLSAVYHLLGDIESRAGEHSEAVRWYKLAIACDERLGNDRGRAKTLNNLCIVANAMGELGDARDYITESLQIKEKIGDRVDLAYGYHQMAVICEEEQNVPEAIRWLEKALEVKEELGDPYQLAYTYFALMNIAKDQGDAAANSRWQNKATEALDRIDDADQLLRWGLNAEQRSSNREAKLIYLRCCEVAHARGEQEVESCSYHRLGGLAVNLKEYELAHRCFAASLRLDQGLGLDTKERGESNKKWLSWLERVSS